MRLREAADQIIIEARPRRCFTHRMSYQFRGIGLSAGRSRGEQIMSRFRCWSGCALALLAIHACPSDSLAQGRWTGTSYGQSRGPLRLAQMQSPAPRREMMVDPAATMSPSQSDGGSYSISDGGESYDSSM